MNEPQWGPVYWRVVPFVDAIDIIDSKGDKIASVSDRPVGMIGEPPANAHLIAAAPALYDELESLVSLIEGKIWTTNDLTYAKSILAKARGEKDGGF